MRHASPAPPTRYWGKLLLAALLLACLASTITACPPIEERIEITDQGMSVILNACTTNGNCDIDDAAHIASMPSRTESTQLRAQLLLVKIDQEVNTLNQATLEASSACIEMSFGCIFDADREGSTECLAAALNDALNKAMPDGLGFDGLDDLDDVLVILTLHNPNSSQSSPADTECRAENIFACAGLDTLTSNYDVVCGSCIGGPKSNTAVGPPCVGACFVVQCYRFLKQQAKLAESDN